MMSQRLKRIRFWNLCLFNKRGYQPLLLASPLKLLSEITLELFQVSIPDAER